MAKWSEAELREVVDLESAKRGRLGLAASQHAQGSGKATRVVRHASKAGVKGVKVDFLDHEAKEVIDLYQAVLRDAAEHHLMINFHGANKPAGESRVAERDDARRYLRSGASTPEL